MGKNIYQRIADVMRDVQYLAKDDEVDAGMGKKYRAITEEKVTRTVRESMVKNGLVMFPASMRTNLASETVQTAKGERINRITHIDVDYVIANVEEPGEQIIVASSGTGVDSQDKGIGKAMTYAYKYALLRTFAIPTGEDPDQISSDVYTDKLYGEKSEKKDEAEELREKLIAMGGGNMQRVKTFAERIFPGVVFEKMTYAQLAKIKVKLAEALANANQGS